MTDPKPRINLNISGELKEWITKEANARRFNNDSEFLRYLIYQEKVKSETLNEIEASVLEYLHSPEGQASIQQMIRAEVQSDEVRRLIKQVVDDILKEYVVEEE